MQKLLKTLLESVRELKVIRNLVLCAMFAAMAVVLGFYTIRIGSFIKIGFAGIPNQIVACLFGPAVGAMFGGALDILKFIINPDGTFFPGFTVSAIVAGFIYGVFYYKRNPSFIRVFIASFLVNVIVNIGLNTLWLAILYNYDGMKFLTVLQARAVKNLVMTPVDAIVFWTIMRPVGEIVKRLMPGKLAVTSAARNKKADV